MRSKSLGSSFDELLAKKGVAEISDNGAVKRQFAYQLRETLEAERISKTELAARLHTSRSALDRLLDPENDSVTIQTLKRAAAVLGKRLRLELV